MKRIAFIVVLLATNVLWNGHLRADQVINGIFTPTPANHKFPYVGMDNGWQERLEQIPGVEFENQAGEVQEAFQTMQDSGLNAVRVTVDLGQPLTSTALSGSPSTLEGEAGAYTLDYGGVDLQVDIARRARAAGMKVIVTVDMGYNIPGPGHDYGQPATYDHWQTDDYSDMLNDIAAETKRLLDPFLQAGIQPDIFVASDETDGGILGYSYDGKGNRSLGNPTYYNLGNLAAGSTATGDDTVYPKFVGFIKEELNTAKGEVQNYFGGTAGSTRYALHCKGGAPSWYYGRMFSSSPASETVASWNGANQTCDAVVNATQINTLPKLPNMVDVLGLSYYFATPTAGTQAAFATAFSNPGNDQNFPTFTSDMETWGLASNLSSNGAAYASGPYNGEPAKKCLVLETDTGLTYGTAPNNGTITIPIEQQFVNYCFQQFALPANDNLVLGAMWWEGELTEHNGTYALYSLPPSGFVHQATPVMTTWGQYGEQSPNVAYTLYNPSANLYMTSGQWFGSWNSLGEITPFPQTAQTFHVSYNEANDSYTYTNDREGGVLGVWSDSEGSGARIELTPPSSPPENFQEWSFVCNGDGSNQLIDVGTGLAMDNSGPDQDEPNTSDASQQWIFSPLMRYNIVNVANGLVIDSGLPNLYGGQYTGLQDLANNFTVSQQWSVVSDYNQNLSPNTYYRIVGYHILDTNAEQPFLLAPWFNDKTVGDHVEQTPLQSGGIQTTQEWTLVPVQVDGETAYQFINRYSGLALDAPSGPIIQSTPNSSDTQLWRLVPSD